MKKKGLFICTIFLCSLFTPLSTAITPTDIAIDGSLDEWPSDTLMQTDTNQVNLHLNWNSTHVFFAWEGTDWKSTTEEQTYSYISILHQKVRFCLRLRLHHTLKQTMVLF